MPPLQHLHRAPLHPLEANTPLAPTNQHLRQGLREMELRQEHLRGRVLGRAFLARQAELEHRVLEIEAVAHDVAYGRDGRRPDVGFGGAVAGVAGEGGGGGRGGEGGGGGHGGGGEDGFEVGGADQGGGVGRAGLGEGGGGVVEGGGGWVGGVGGVGGGEEMVVEGVNGEVFAVPEVAPLVVVLIGSAGQWVRG